MFGYMWQIYFIRQVRRKTVAEGKRGEAGFLWVPYWPFILQKVPQSYITSEKSMW